MCRVTMGHLRVTVGHPRVTIGYLRATMGHLRLTVGYLKATVVHIRVTLGHLKVTRYRLFFSISKHKENTTELHPKVRQTCYQLLYVTCFFNSMTWVLQHTTQSAPDSWFQSVRHDKSFHSENNYWIQISKICARCDI